MRYSKQRNLVLEIVQNSTIHPTAEQVYQEAKARQSNIGIATVYRNLNSFVESGELSKLTLGGVDRFDGNISKHYHLRCPKCNKLIDIIPVDDKMLEEGRELVKKAFAQEEQLADFSNIILECLCPSCREKN